MDHITTLPNEVLHHILKDVEIIDLATLSASCRTLRNFIQDNKPLFKEVYLHKFDEPPQGRGNVVENDWEKDLHKFVELERIMAYRSIDQKLPHINTVAETVGHFISKSSRISPSKNIELLAPHFHDTNNQEAFLCQSTIFNRAKVPKAPLSAPKSPITFAERQATAKLHCLYGVPILMPKRTHFSHLYPYACSVVYDMRNYTDENFWGPFQHDSKATVDWERMEAVMIVLGHNLKQFSENTHGVFRPIWREPFRGANPLSFDPIALTKKRRAPDGPSNAEDPYNITGTWMRVVCFLDFHDLHHYNFSTPDPGANNPRPPIDTQEAIRMIIMELTVTSIKHAGEVDGPGPDDDPNWPVVTFTGMSRSMHAAWDPNANSNIRGRVCVTKEGEVRWTTWSIYWAEERWKSEGIQIGGMDSARGVFGHWFDKNLSDEGPAGPTAFWKVSNEIGKEEDDDEPTERHEQDEDDDDADDPDYGDDEDDEDLHFHLPAHIVVVLSEHEEVQD